MMFFVLVVIHDSALIEDLLAAWEEVGVTGATILPSSGLGRLRQTGLLEDLPLFPGLEDLFQHEEEFSQTIFTVVKGQEFVDQVVAATQRVIGDFSQPDTGLLIVLPVLQAFGLEKKPLEK